MLRPYFVLAGLLLGTTPAALAQSQSLNEPVRISKTNSYKVPSPTIPTVTLGNARPDAAPGLMQSDSRLSGIGDEITYAFKANLAEDFQVQPKTGGLLLEPRLTKYSSSDAVHEGYSAEIRVGNVKFERSDSQPTGWYVFAAADGEAVSFNAKSLTGPRDAMTVTLADQITVGDLQAGVSTYIANGTQLTFSYIETEASFSARGGLSTSKRESFAGISLSKEF